jgi:hypothetical protein
VQKIENGRLTQNHCSEMSHIRFVIIMMMINHHHLRLGASSEIED